MYNNEHLYCASNKITTNYMKIVIHFSSTLRTFNNPIKKHYSGYLLDVKNSSKYVHKL